MLFLVFLLRPFLAPFSVFVGASWVHLALLWPHAPPFGEILAPSWGPFGTSVKQISGNFLGGTFFLIFHEPMLANDNENNDDNAKPNHDDSNASSSDKQFSEGAQTRTSKDSNCGDSIHNSVLGA